MEQFSSLLEISDSHSPEHFSELNSFKNSTTYIWGTNIVVQEMMDSFKSFINKFTLDHHSSHYIELLKQANIAENFSISLNLQHLLQFKPTLKLFKQIMLYPQEVIPIMELILNSIYNEIFKPVQPISIQLCPFALGRSHNIRLLDPSYIDQLISLKGLVIRVSNVIPEMRIGLFFFITYSLFLLF